MFCLSLVNPIYTTLPFSSNVSGLTISNSTPQSEICGDRQDNDLNGLVDDKLPRQFIFSRDSGC